MRLGEEDAARGGRGEGGGCRRCCREWNEGRRAALEVRGYLFSVLGRRFGGERLVLFGSKDGARHGWPASRSDLATGFPPRRAGQVVHRLDIRGCANSRRAVSTASPPAAPSGVYPLAGLRRSPRLASPPGPRLLPSVRSYASSRAAAFGAIHLPAHQFRPCLVARFPSSLGVAARRGAVATRPRRKLLAASASGSCAAVLLLPRRL